MKYHTPDQCCLKLKAVETILKSIKELGRDNVYVVHNADSALALISELTSELKEE